MKNFLRGIINPTTFLTILSGASLAIVFDWLTGLLSDSLRNVQIIVVILTALFWLIKAWDDQRRQVIKTAFQPPQTRRTPIERMTNARRGMIAFVSLYRPIDKDCLGHSLSGEQKVEAAQAGDYERLDLEKSNLATIITTIDSHASKLEHLWLIATADSVQPGSETYRDVLIRYLKEHKGLTCKFHAGDQYTVSLEDDALVATKTRDMVNTIFDEAQKHGLDNQAVVADFSGCPRSMTLGMFAACIDGRRSLQFAGVRYDANSQPTGKIFPIVYDFKPELDTQDS